jgi:putative restriction endonuclease
MTLLPESEALGDHATPLENAVDIHTLFDRGYLTITPEHAVEVSGRLKDEFDNGKEYYALHGRQILLPVAPAFRPSPDQLAWHNEHVYRA